MPLFKLTYTNKWGHQERIDLVEAPNEDAIRNLLRKFSLENVEIEYADCKSLTSYHEHLSRWLHPWLYE